MVFNVTVNAQYKENCEFKKSELQSDLPLITNKQPVICDLKILQDENEVENIIIGDVCTFKITVTSFDLPVRQGYIKLFFDGNEIDGQFYLNNNGQVSITYQPIINKNNINVKVYYYDDDGLFNTNNVQKTLNVKRKGTKINFTNNNYIINNKEEKVNFKVQVKTSDDIPVTYGRVTFFHRYEYNDNTQEDDDRIIGNPVFLDEHGVAEINYMPSQYYDNTDEISRESIIAIYNYPGNGSEYLWDYYDTSRAITELSIKEPADIYHIYAHKDTNLRNILDKYDYKWSHIAEEDEVYFLIKVYDDEGNEKEFTNEDSIYFCMNGTIATDDYAEFIFNKEIYYDNTKGGFHIDLQQALESDNRVLSPGYYNIYCTSNLDDKLIYDEYAQYANASMVYYLQVDYNDSSSEIDISFDANEYQGRINDEITLTTTLSTDNQEIKNALNHQPCVFYSPTTQELYSGTINLVNNVLKAQIDYPLKFSNINDYTFYMYIRGGLYDNIKINTIYSNTVIVIIDGNVDIEIDINNYKNIYPGEVEYNVRALQLKDTSPVKIYNDNELIFDNTFDSSYRKCSGIIKDISPGTHTLEVKVKHETANKQYTILSSNISYEAINAEVVPSPMQQVGIILTATGESFAHIDLNDINNYFNVYISDNSNDIGTLCHIESAELNKNNLILYFNLGKYTENTWYINLRYIKDNFYQINVEKPSFDTVLKTPDYGVIKDNSYNIHIDLNTYNENIPILVEMSDGNDFERILGITNKNGELTITAPSNLTNWLTYNTVTLSINPVDNRLINSIIANENNQLSSLPYYSRICYGRNNTSTDIYNELRAQLIAYESTYLFTRYKTYSISYEV